MKFEKITPGMVLFHVGRTKMGNTTLSTVSVWRVRIISVDAERRTAVVSWNGNRERTYYEEQLSKLKAESPMLVKAGIGMRLATREEKAAAKAERAAKASNPPTPAAAA